MQNYKKVLTQLLSDSDLALPIKLTLTTLLTKMSESDIVEFVADAKVIIRAVMSNPESAQRLQARGVKLENVQKFLNKIE